MKGKLIKEMHEMGIFRNPKTKQKLELMKLSDILQVKKFVLEEKANGNDLDQRTKVDYEFINANELKRNKLSKLEMKKKRN